MKTQINDVSTHTQLSIDQNGHWFYGDQEIIHPEVLKAFQTGLVRDAQGHHRVYLENECCSVQVSDAALVALTIREDDQGLWLVLSCGEIFRLEPDSLRLGTSGALYADGPRGLIIRLSRAAHSLLAQAIDEDEQGYYLRTGGRVCRLKLD